MSQELLRAGNFFKANLHCHTTLSDGDFSPAQIKALYKANGYSVVAFTDHVYMEDHSDLDDAGFLTLKGYENAVGEGEKVYHLNFYATDPKITGLVGITDYAYRWFQVFKPAAQQAKIVLPEGFCDGEYSVANVNSILGRAADAGYLVALNHPVWSLQTPEDYLGLKGLWGVEVYNHGCFMDGFQEENPAVYDAMLKDGQRIFCTANDDNHNRIPDWDVFGGFTMIRADRLDYPSIIQALKKGDFYASTGANLESIVLENGKFIVRAQNAKYISMSTDRRTACRFRGENLREAVFAADPGCGYFRFVVEDDRGRRAYSRAYFADELEMRG